MPSKTNYVTEHVIRQTPLPTHGGRYSVIPHGDVIHETRRSLQRVGLSIEKELYKCSHDGQIAQGIYHLGSSQDPEIGMMFAWANSYNKTTRFKCAVGARVFVCDNGMVSGDMASYSRLHKGKGAMRDVIHSIQWQISQAGKHFAPLIGDKEMFKTERLDKEHQASILGQLYVVEDILNLHQVGIVRREMEKPSHAYGADPDSVWAMYNHVTLALKESHPLTFLRDHERVHQYFVDLTIRQSSSQGQKALVDIPHSLMSITKETVERDDVALISADENMFGVQFS
jgi:hypothetical protein